MQIWKDMFMLGFWCSTVWFVALVCVNSLCSLCWKYLLSVIMFNIWQCCQGRFSVSVWDIRVGHRLMLLDRDFNYNQLYFFVNIKIKNIFRKSSWQKLSNYCTWRTVNRCKHIHVKYSLTHPVVKFQSLPWWRVCKIQHVGAPMSRQIGL